MKLPLKYIAILVIVSLTGIFAYQAYWLVNMYHTMKEQTEVTILNSIRNADHIELFTRLDSLSEASEQQRVMGMAANQRAEISFSASFSDKNEDENNAVLKQKFETDSVNIETERKLSQRDKEPDFRVGDGYESLEKMAMSLQKGLHQTIDQEIVGINIERFDSILNEDLRKSNLDITHYTHVLKLTNDSILLTSLPATVDTTKLTCYEYIYDIDEDYAYHVYTDSSGKLALRQMRGILTTSFIILLILGFSFWYLIHTLLKQRTLEEMKTDFTNNITHELKTPIAVAYAATDALLNFSQADEKIKRDKYLNITKEQLERLGGLVEQILSMSIERRKSLRLKEEEVQIKPLVSSLIEQHTLKAGRQARFVMDIQPDDLTIITDRTHFSNIVSNLIDNAVKYSPEGAEVTITARLKDNNQLQLSVSDKGIGIPTDKQNFIFDKFYRVPSGNQHDVKGYGLGLFYVKNMVEKMQGTIKVESEIGKGSTFTISLPMHL